ncbi:hypothetical protein D3C72_2139380 [compost metagenome]
MGLSIFHNLFHKKTAASLSPFIPCHDKILQLDDRASFYCAEHKHQIDHPDNPILPLKKQQPAPVGVMQNQFQSLSLLLNIANTGKILFYGK